MRSTPATSWPDPPRSTGRAPTTWGATSSTGSWWRPGCPSSSPCSPRPSRSSSGSCSARPRSCSAAAPPRTVTASVNLAVAFPGLLLALFFAVIFGVGRQGCGPGHRTGRSPHVRAPHADPRRQRGRPRLRRRRAHDRRRAVPDPAAPRAAQHQRAARRQRHDRRRGSVAGLRRALLPRPRRPVAELRLGSPPLRRHRRDLRQPRCCPGPGDRRPRGRTGLQPLRGVRREGPRHRPHRRRPPPPRHPGRDHGADSCGGRRPARLLRPGARRPRPRGHLPGSARPDPPGARRDLLGQAGRGARHRGGVRVGQVADRAGGLASRRPTRAGWTPPDWSCSAPTCEPGTRRCRGASSAPPSPWCSRTR